MPVSYEVEFVNYEECWSHFFLVCVQFHIIWSFAIWILVNLPNISLEKSYTWLTSRKSWGSDIFNSIMCNNVVPGQQAAWESTWKLIQNAHSQAPLIGREALELHPSNLGLNKFFTWFQCTLVLRTTNLIYNFQILKFFFFFLLKGVEYIKVYFKMYLGLGKVNADIWNICVAYKKKQYVIISQE